MAEQAIKQAQYKCEKFRTSGGKYKKKLTNPNH